MDAPALSSSPPFDPRLVSLIAAGVGDPYDLAAEFGVPASQFERLRQTPAFQTALEKARKELEEQGYSAEYAEMALLQEAVPTMARDLIMRFHQTQTTTDQRLKIYEVVNRQLQERRTRLAPKQTQAPTANLPRIEIVMADGTAISVSAQAPVAAQPITIDVTPEDSEA